MRAALAVRAAGNVGVSGGYSDGWRRQEKELIAGEGSGGRRRQWWQEKAVVAGEGSDDRRIQ